MKKEHFNVGDKVFAKIKGYPAWPAIVLEEKGKKYKVKFYGTGEIGQIKLEDLFYYTRNKAKLLKPSKRKDFNDSVREIEEAILEAGTDGDPDYGNEKNDSILSESSLAESDTSISKKRKRSTSSVKISEDTPSSKPKKGKIASISSKIDEVNCPVVIKTEEEPDTEDSKDEEAVKVTNCEQNEKDIVKEESNEKNAEETIVENDITYEETPVEEPTKPGYEDFVLETELEAFIAYGEYVGKHKEIYIKEPVQERHSTKTQVLPIFIEDDCIGIKLHENWCIDTFKNEYERANYDKEIAERALKIKKSFHLDNLKETPEIFCTDLKANEKEIKLLWEKKLMTIKEDILAKLKVEGELIEIDSKIKSCLNLDKADPKEAITLLKKMLELNVLPVMLKKHAHVIDMVRRLKKYVGNLESWNLSEDDANAFKKDAEKVREVALKLHVKFMKIIGNPDKYKSFWDHFNEITTKFREETKDLSEMEFYLLTSWPYSRENFLNHYFIKDISISLPPQINNSENVGVQ